MTTTGILPERMKKVIAGYEKFKGDPSMEARVVEMYAVLEDEFMRLRAAAPEASVDSIRFENPEKHALYLKLGEIRKSLKTRR